MASHLRTSIVAIVVLVLAVPVLFWLKSLGLVLGDPWVLALLLPLVIFVGDDRAQQQLGSGRLDDRPLLRLVLAAMLVTVLCWSAGWSMLVPAASSAEGPPGQSRPVRRVGILAASVVAAATLPSQIGVALGYIPTVVEPSQSHVGAGWLLLIALATIVAVARDAGDQKASADALARAEARLRALMESLSLIHI